MMTKIIAFYMRDTNNYDESGLKLKKLKKKRKRAVLRVTVIFSQIPI